MMKRKLNFACVLLLFIIMGSLVISTFIWFDVPLSSFGDYLKIPATSSPIEESVFPSNITHVMIASDRSRMVGMIAAINSIVSHTLNPVFFHLVTPDTDIEYLRNWITDTKLNTISYTVTGYPSSLNNVYDSNVPYDIKYATLYIPLLFPNINGSLVYIDDDIIVQEDIKHLSDALPKHGPYAVFSSDCNSVSKRFSVIPNTYASFLNFNNENIKALHISPGACTFNTGVFVINVTEWRRQDITKKLDSWVKLSESEPIFKDHHSGQVIQSVFMIVFHNNFISLNPMWNVRHLGLTPGSHYSRTFLHQAKLLHWNGPLKPWGRRSSHAEFWERYYIPDPSGQFHLLRKKRV